MSTEVKRNSVMSVYNAIAEVIREHGKISLGQLCVETHYRESTILQKWRAMKPLFPDLKKEGNFFSSSRNKGGSE